MEESLRKEEEARIALEQRTIHSQGLAWTVLSGTVIQNGSRIDAANNQASAFTARPLKAVAAVVASNATDQEKEAALNADLKRILVVEFEGDGAVMTVSI